MLLWRWDAILANKESRKGRRRSRIAQALSTRRTWCTGERGRRPSVKRKRVRKLILLIFAWFLFPHRGVRSPGPIGDHMHINRVRNRAEPERRDLWAQETSIDDTSSRDKPAHERASSQARPELEPPPVTFAD